MSEDVVFKGSRAGLELVFSETAEFSSIVEQLRIKLESAINFFGKGTTVNVAANKMTKQQQKELSVLFHHYGLTLKTVDLTAAKPVIGKKDAVVDPKVEETTVINKTVRGGQEIICKGSVVIYGNVNPGAKVIAGGNILIRGTCRGLVHAGAFGDMKAAVIADRMLAMQIRIANLIARAPDHLEKMDCTECACIKEGNIVIEPVNRQEVS